ncbi:MAG: hypothetical protein HY908_36405 [Myxococcales bacterium]|nr:hypothetical protein [Myxococcales bacterium]
MTDGAAFDLPRLRAAYGLFLRPGRILLTGHSHQAWPDVARAAPLAAFDDAARYCDDKWSEVVFPLAAEVAGRLAARLGFAPTDPITFGPNSHTLVYALLSAVVSPHGGAPRGPGAVPGHPRIVTTTGEFHSLDRQLRRLAEDGVVVDWVAAEPRATLTERLFEAVSRPAALLALSAVLFEDAWIVESLGELCARAVDSGALVLVDAYHAFNVVPLDWGPAAGALHVVAGGYKYGELGEGVCFLRSPPGSPLRPAFTGWYADFGGLEGARAAGAPVGYGPGGARFAGSTFDPTSLYRARAVLDHFDAFGLGVPELRAISMRQTARLVAGLDRAGLPLATSREPARRGGFVAVRPPRVSEVVRRLRACGVFVDARGELLRLGPAPYLTDDELDAGVTALADTVRALA